MIMHTLAESYDFTGRTVHPFTTHAMSGLGTAERQYSRSCRGATIGAGLAVAAARRCARTGRRRAAAWLDRIGLRRRPDDQCRADGCDSHSHERRPRHAVDDRAPTTDAPSEEPWR